MKKVYILGGAQTDFERNWKKEGKNTIALLKEALADGLANADLSFEVTPFVIEQIGNIINAEDMLDIWKDIGVKVTRIDRGTPKEIPLFAKTLEDADGNVDKAVFEKIKKLLRSIV